MGAWSGSSVEKVELLSGVEDLRQVMRKRRIRWAASIYARNLPVLRETAEKILHPIFEIENVAWNWVNGMVDRKERQQVSMIEWEEQVEMEYSDGSRVAGTVAGATTQNAEYLGRYATVIDTEMNEIALSLEAGNYRVALDSQGAITRTMQLYVDPARPWIEHRIQQAMQRMPT